MRMWQADSTNIAAVGYDVARMALRVRFKSGQTYEYTKVPLGTFGEFMAAPSLGGHLTRFIKPHYTAVKVEEGSV